MTAVQDNTRLYRGQGQVFLAERKCGKPAGLQFIGNVSELMLNPQTEKIEHTESQTGNNSVDKVIERGLKVEMSMTIDSFASENLARMVFGDSNDVVAGTVTGEPITVGGNGNIILANINVQAITALTDAVGTAFVQGTDWDIVDLAAGMICFIEGGAIIDATGAVLITDLLVDYSYADYECVAAFTKPNTEYWLRFNGLNTAENNNPVIIDCYKVRFAPTDDVPMINNDDLAEFKQSADILFDACQPVTSKMGRYFAVRQLAAANSGDDCC